VKAERIFALGVGGVGMAGLARMLLQAGQEVYGCDVAETALVQELCGEGLHFHPGHQRKLLPENLDWAFRTPAVLESSPDLQALREAQVPVFRRAQVLGRLAASRTGLAVAGAHGKTTTSAILATLLREAGLECGYAVGGETALPGRVADWGSAAEFVFEADESDGSLVQYQPAVSILNSVEWDHVERFPTEEALLRLYRHFALRSSELWLREDDLLAARCAKGHRAVSRVGRSAHCELQLLERQDLPGAQRFVWRWRGREVESSLSLPGEHNTFNALLALGVALGRGLDPEELSLGLASFTSVGRRLDHFVDAKGRRVIHDYAHHPTEIRALLQAARSWQPRHIRLVFEPHRYSRTRHLLQPFAEVLSQAEELDLLPVYAASEHPEQGADSAELLEACRQLAPERPSRLWSHQDLLLQQVEHDAEADCWLLAGAGRISELYEKLKSDN